LKEDLIDNLIKEVHILERVKIESYIIPYLDLRPVSQITIPAELPEGAEMGQKIDKNAKPMMSKLRSITDPRRKAVAIQALKKFLGKNFEEIVKDSVTYRAHYKWADEMNLRNSQYQVRPTVHEIYFYKDRESGRKLKKLMKERERLRMKARRNPKPDLGGIQFAYPEEFDEKWILHMGKLLGYPECCSKRYAQDRINGINVEARAANQLNEKINNDIPVDPHAYPLSYFFPCNPSCTNAIKLGLGWKEKLREFDHRIASIYRDQIENNLKMVLKQPELIQRYFNQINT
jgi:hypothetical protein